MMTASRLGSFALPFILACGSPNPIGVDGGGLEDAGLADANVDGNDGVDGGDEPMVGDFCEEDGWCWQRPTPFGSNLFASWGSAPDDVWAVGANGTMAHYDGVGWRLASSHTEADLFGIWGASKQDIWAVGAGGTLVHFNGTSWSSATSPTTKQLNAIHGTSASDIYAVGAEDTRLHWDGTAWTQLPTVYPGAGIKPNQHGVWASASGEVWSAGIPYLQSIPHRTGGSWTTTDVANVNSTTFKGIWGSSDTDVWITGEPGGQGSLQRWDGLAWHSVYPPSAAMLSTPISITGSGPSDVWFFGGWSGSGRWNGTQFVAQPDLRYEYLTAGWVHPSGEGWAVGYGGRIAHKTSLDGGWSFISGSPSGGYDTLSELAVIGDNDAWAVGRLSIAHWNGTAWLEVDPAITPYRQEFNDVWASAPNDVWATAWGSNSPDNLQHWNGTAWTTTPHPGPSYLNAVWGSAANDVWVAYSGGNGGMHFNGTAWQTTTPGPGGDSTSMHGTASNDIWCVGLSGFLRHFDGTAWTTKTSGTTEALYAIRAFSTTDAWIAGENATLRRWNGVSWQAAVAPAVSVGSDGRRAITRLDGPSSSDLWAATSSGELFHFDGTSWTRSARLSVGLSTIARAPSGAMFAAGHNGAIFRRAP